jgi:hypothetical protein
MKQELRVTSAGNLFDINTAVMLAGKYHGTVASNTGTTKLYRTEKGAYILISTSCFEGVETNYDEVSKDSARRFFASADWTNEENAEELRTADQAELI